MEIINTFKENGNKENALAMKAYMKGNFEFLGIKSPLRRHLQREFLKNIDKKAPINKNLVKLLWNEDNREFQYLAIDYLVKVKKQLQRKDIIFIEELITTKSWWDSVDIIASHLVGEICKMYPNLIDEYILKWSIDENMWLRRTSILYQLKYKENLDTRNLEKVIKANLEDKEFFIRKSIGWALREYSKTNKEWVRNFIKHNQLSNLSIKEGSKYL
jgi:3-methyladenine DNA glycosylase AlkD